VRKNRCSLYSGIESQVPDKPGVFSGFPGVPDIFSGILRVYRMYPEFGRKPGENPDKPGMTRNDKTRPGMTEQF
jgi:hypothetical protein